jgi:O-antigen/teichoic acid export membrane protein
MANDKSSEDTPPHHDMSGYASRGQTRHIRQIHPQLNAQTSQQTPEMPAFEFPTQKAAVNEGNTATFVSELPTQKLAIDEMQTATSLPIVSHRRLPEGKVSDGLLSGVRGIAQNSIGQPYGGQASDVPPTTDMYIGYGQTVPLPSLFATGYRNDDQWIEDNGFDTMPTLLLRSIAIQQGNPPTVMQAEISGAAKGAAIMGIGNIAATFLKYGTNLLIQRGYGAALYGLYSISFSLVTLVASILDLGLDNAMIRYLAIYRSKKRVNSIRGLAIFCTFLAGGIGILGAVALLLFAPWLAALRNEPQLIVLLRIMAPMIPLLCMQVVWLGGLQGFKAFKWRVLAERFIPSIMLLVLISVMLIFNRTLEGVALATVISTFVSAILSLYFLWRLVSRNRMQEPAHYEIATWLGFGIPNFLTTITEVVIESLDMLLLTFFAITDIAIGQYAAGEKISGVILMPLISLNAMFAPTIAELYYNGERRKLMTMFQIVTKWTIIFSFPIFLIATLFSKPLLSLSGRAFAEAWPLLVILALGSMVNTGTGCVGYMLLMTGHQKLSLVDSLLAVIMNVLLGIFLTSHYGVMGTAVATTLTMTVVNLLKLLQVRLLLKMQPYRWDTLKPLGAGLLGGVLTGLLLFWLRDAHTLIQLSLIPFFLACYGGLIVLFKISPEDRIVVDALRKKLLRNKR